MPRFLVHYRLLGLPGRVRVLGLSFSRLVPGASVRVRCTRGCGVAEERSATLSGRARSTSFAGRWLRRGAVIEVRAVKGGWGGVYARVVVTGPPRGIRISHACLLDTRRVSCARLERR